MAFYRRRPRPDAEKCADPAKARASALETLGDSSAAEAARQAHADDAVSSAPTGDRVTDAANTIKSRFDVKIFQLVLLIIAAVGVFGLIFSVVMIVQSMRE